jgi:hypothetical protein
VDCNSTTYGAQERLENGSSSNDVGTMQMALRKALMDVPGLSDLCFTTGDRSNKKSKSSRGRKAVQAGPPIPLLELPSWPPQEKRPRRACVPRPNYNDAFSDGKCSAGLSLMCGSPDVPAADRLIG